MHGERNTYANYHEQKPAVEFLYDLEEDADQMNKLASDPGHTEILNKMCSRTKNNLKEYRRSEIIKLKGAPKSPRR